MAGVVVGAMSSVSALGMGIGLSLGLAATHAADTARLLDYVSLQATFAAQVEAGIETESPLMAACDGALSAPSCRCMLERIEREIGLLRFVDAAVEGPGAAARDAGYGAAAARARTSCRPPTSVAPTPAPADPASLPAMTGVIEQPHTG